MKELRNFRQLHSATPGHPEFGCAPGVETTTGPLGQGLANAVGMALGEKVLSAQFNRPGHTIVDHRTYVFLGDGCLMEGVSHEACSLAGTLGLGKLIAIWDNNGISIDGEVDAWFTDNTAQRFRAYGWQVIEDVDGHDADSIARALEQAGEDSSRPTLLCCRTVIGWGSPNKQGRESSHGAPLGEDEVALVRETIDWPHAPFEVPEEITAAWCAREVGAAREAAWSERFTAYRTAHPGLAAEYERRINGDLPTDWQVGASTFINSVVNAGESVASRQASRQALDGFGPMLPELIGGSADLAGSNLTIWSGASPITADNARGNYIHFGVREFGMSAMTNGLALHGGFLPYCATFLVFSDYARNAIRLSALIKFGRCLFTRMIPSVLAKTALPISLLSTLRRCASFPTCRSGVLVTRLRQRLLGRQRSSDAMDPPLCCCRVRGLLFRLVVQISWLTYGGGGMYCMMAQAHPMPTLLRRDPRGR